MIETGLLLKHQSGGTLTDDELHDLIEGFRLFVKDISDPEQRLLRERVTVELNILAGIEQARLHQKRWEEKKKLGVY
jgi:hypothetical protein